MTLELLWKITALFVALFVLGTIASIPLFKSFTRLRQSALWTKILWWWPIFIGFIIVLFGGIAISVLVSGLLITGGIRELRNTHAYRSRRALIYLSLLSVFMSHLVLFWATFNPGTVVTALILICFASVLSDVVAFFMGNYIGRHRLPAWINPGKSWEGVAGQIVGACAGYGLVSLMLAIPFSFVLAVTIGVASALGDLSNSIVKRSIGIKDWGNTIPGHGGILDRFSSLATATAFMYWMLRLA